jgi:hypothetical protein
MMRRLLVLLLFAAALPAAAQDRGSQRLAPGNSLCLSGIVIDACAPSYNPPTGNYNILYTGSGSPKGTDDFNILIFTGSAPAIYTFPASTSSVFPVGHGAGIKNLGIAPLTVTATTSTISGAPGVINGSPPLIGGPFVLFPGGEAWLQATSSNNYFVTGFNPGTWFQYAQNVPALQWTGLSGYVEYDLHCSGLSPATTGDTPVLQVAYGGSFQSSGYQWVRTRLNQGSASLSIDSGPNSGPPPAAGDTSISLAGSDNTVPTADGTAFQIHITAAVGTGAGSRVSISGLSSYFSGSTASEAQGTITGAGPYSLSAALTGIKIFNGGTNSNIASGICWLRPSL